MNTTEELLDLLPVHLRVRDEETGGLLRALLDVVAGELGILNADLDDLYASWFVETAPEWVIPYLADLVGVGDLPAEAEGTVSRRAYVANTIGYRRRKGTVAVIEQVARDASGWPATAIEFFSRLSASGNVNHVRPDRPATASLRGAAQLDLVPPAVAVGALDPLGHTGEVRHIAGGGGRYNIGHVGVFLYGTQVYAFNSADPDDWPDAVPTADGYAVHPLGRPTPLFAPPTLEDTVEHLAVEADLPVPLRPRRLLDLLTAARVDPRLPLPVGVEIDGTVLRPDRLRVTGLEELATGAGPQAMIDPVGGRLVTFEGTTRSTPALVRVAHAYGSVADVGAGPYDRAGVHADALARQGFVGDGDSTRPDVRAQVAVGAGDSLATALTDAETAWAGADSPAGGTYVLSIAGSTRQAGDLAVTVPPATRLIIVAASWQDRVLRTGEVLPPVPGEYAPEGLRPVLDGRLEITGGDGSAVLLDGVVITGDVVVAAGDLGWLTVSQCTLAGEVRVNGTGATANERCSVALCRTLATRVRLADSVPALTIVDSVLDRPTAKAVLGAAVAVAVEGSTIRGAVDCRTLEAGNAIFDGTVTVEHRQVGCVRYSYLGAGSRAPRRFACVSGDGGRHAPAPVYSRSRRARPPIWPWRIAARPRSRPAARASRKWVCTTGCSDRPGCVPLHGCCSRTWEWAWRSDCSGADMHGDFSRWTYRPGRGYRSVLLQQGRVLLDADWNEQTELIRQHEETRTRDVVGDSGGPVGDGGFSITDDTGSAPAGAAWAELRLTGGRYYVDGILCESTLTSLAAQPFLGLVEPPAGTYVAFLDVWQRQVTADEDPQLREPALGGPDTTTRSQTVWQVRLTDRGAALCSDLDRDLLPRTIPRLTASIDDAPAGADPCEITASGGYRLLENQLYRVQIHRPRTGGRPATYTWSRENGSVVARVLGIDPVSGHPDQSMLTLDREGRDDTLSFNRGDLVELTSTTRELRGEPGSLVIADSPIGTTLKITWAAPADVVDLAGLGEHPIARRWEGTDTATTAAKDLEGGVQVAFPESADARTGDYWLIPARTVRLEYGVGTRAGTIDWPTDAGGDPVPQAPAGPHHHTAAIGLLTRDAAGWTLDGDCRRLFPPLTELITLDLAGGDGQEAMPGDPLPEPVRVVVRNGGLPVPTAAVEFVASDGGALSVDRTTWTTGAHPVLTEADGVAEIGWRLAAGGPSTQTLTVRRVDDHGVALDPDLVVTGRLSIASQVQWSPVCDGFAATRTVQDALGQLVTTLGFALLGGDGQHATAQGQVLPQPVRVRLDSPCGPAVKQEVVATCSDKGLVEPADPGKPRPTVLTGPDAGQQTTALTDADGVATFWWQPGFDNEPSSALSLVSAEVPDTVAVVGAQLIIPYVPPAGVHVVKLQFGDDKPFVNDSTVGARSLGRGIQATLDGVVVPETVKAKPVVRVLLDLPWPLGEDGTMWGDQPIGFRSITLAGEQTGEGRSLHWVPDEITRGWLEDTLWGVLAQNKWDRPILGRYELDGWAVIGADDAELHLNGHSRTIGRGGQTFVDLPSDDAVTGGRFEQWFWLVADQGVRRITIPDLTGKTAAAGRATLEGLGLAVDQIEEIGGRKGLVLRTEPKAGTDLDPGERVVLVVGTGRLQRPRQPR